ncbi:MAG TPA: monovalent cation:proton antiporter-2 (CPA2) family protein [Gemmatimonadaceae bacterium]|nr:monovalent cation:proton antiporter-2 (CPA2) family protein [Gemmatimonadaceae bacterium]
MSGDGFFFQAFIYLAAAVVSVPLAKRLGLGSVLGYLVAGVAVGPFGFGFVGAEGQDVMHFAEFGVVMMLFLVGLELEPAMLWRLRAPILGLGGLQVAVTSVVVAAVAMVAGQPWQGSLAIGLTLAMSSTAIVLQTLEEKGLLKSPSGQSSFAVLLFQDIAVIPMLAIFPLLATHPVASGGAESHGTTWVEGLPAWARSLAVLGAVVLIVVAGRSIVRPAFRAIAATRLREIFTAAALLLVIGIAILMTQVGLSPALGTFLAGVVLANSEYRHELVSDIEPFKGLLLGLFFIAVGASLDFRLLAERPGAILGMVAVVMLLKLAVLFTLGRVFKLGSDQNLLFAFALSQVGEFAFVLFSFAEQQGVLTPEVTRPLVAVVALTMALTPLVLLLNERVFLPRVATPSAPAREADHIDEENAVIVAGFGSFGQSVGRLLKANGIATTVLDNDGDRVDLLRRIGLKVFYGDASRHDLLHAAGAERAHLIVIALDTAERTLSLVHTVKKHFPHLTILARAHDRQDAYELLEAGVEHVYRESLDTSLRMGSDALRMLGVRAYRAQRAARTFRRHDDATVREMAALRRDRARYIDTARSRIEELERILQEDAEDQAEMRDAGWDAESLREDVARGEFRKKAPGGDGGA